MTNKGEFVGTKRQLEGRRVRWHAQIIKMPRYYTLSNDARVYVDDSGTVYSSNPETGKLTIIVGQCVPKECK